MLESANRWGEKRRARQSRTALWLAAILTLCLTFGTGGASLNLGFHEPEVYLVTVTPLSGTEFEQRVRVGLRLRNPNRREIPFNGLDFALDVNGEPLVRGYNSEEAFSRATENKWCPSIPTPPCST